MIRQHRVMAMTLCLLLILLVPASEATPIPFVMYGSVVEINATTKTMVLDSLCDQFTCDYPVKGRLTAYLPNDQALVRLQEGEVVEVVTKQWINQLTDSPAGLIYPSNAMRDVHQWYAIERLAYSGDNRTLLGTEIFGDPAYISTPLVGGVQVEYRLSGPDPRAYQYGKFPKDTLANCTITTAGGLNRTEVFSSREIRNYTDVRTNLSVSVDFIGGYYTDFMEPKACPCADFHIRVNSGDSEKPVTVPPTTKMQEPAKKSPPGLLLEVLAPVIAMLGYSLRGHRH
jgi:hypothetical protein